MIEEPTMANKTRTQRIAFMCIVSCLWAYTVEATRPDTLATHIRVANTRISEVLRYARKRSPSFGDLLATLELLDRAVYIEEGHCRHREQRACLVLMPTPGAKNLLIRIDPRQPIRLVVAQLAHELYHAVEIAREPDVVNVASLRDLFGRIGEQRCFSGSDDCWETRAALAFEALVTRELAASRTASPPPSR
jgi:hypothetical protein